jgi:DNA-binding Lrp family transcriptional regulator
MLKYKYDPRLKKLEELEHTFACGEKILDELVKNLKPGKNNELSQQSWIITGAHGAGKSHLLVLLYYHVMGNKELYNYWWPLIFPEELHTVDSLYRLLIQVFAYIFKGEAASIIPREIRNELQEIRKVRITGTPKQKKEIRHHLAKQLFQLLVKCKNMTGKVFIFMLENLQYLFREQLPGDDVKHLRSFMNEHPGTFVIIGTALTVFDEIKDYGKPFFHFFKIRGMDNMEGQEIIEFLLKLAAFRQDEGIEEKIEKNRRYIYLYRVLTAGNPRLILFLYELLLDNDTLDTYMILEKITELTPYFLDKTRDESGQRKLILDALAMEAPAQTAREIAEYINEDYKSIAEQLKRLAAEGWVRETPINPANSRKNEVFYRLRDYFYRIWYKVRIKGIEESDIACMAELVVFLFDRKDIEERLKKYETLKIGITTTFDSSRELLHLLDKNSSLSVKFESLCRLLLLGKFSTLTDVFDRLLEESELPADESGKLEFFLEAEILYIMKNRQNHPELKLLIKCWVRLIGKRYDEQAIRDKFLRLIYIYIKTAGKENVLLENIEDVSHQLYEEGIEIPCIILKIISAVKNPCTREAQQWMADPLFSEIVEQLSGDGR